MMIIERVLIQMRKKQLLTGSMVSELFDVCLLKRVVKEMKTRTVISSGKRPNPSDLGN